MNIYRKVTISGLFLLAGGLMVGCGGGGGGNESGQNEDVNDSYLVFEELVSWEILAGDPNDPDLYPVVGFAVERPGAYHPDLVGDPEKYSLNYNRLPRQVIASGPVNWQGPINYDTPNRANRGTASSTHPIRIDRLRNPRLVYTCYFDMESHPQKDVRTVAILNADTGELHYIARMGVGDVATYPEVDCESAHEMHTHVIELNWEWGRIQVQFAFDSVDDMENLGMGWFLYDIQVQALGEAIQLEAR